ncbi:MAG: ChbG/HpnK family deacetylase [Clostridia bacterium]|nr:ChbG/HpnK family deacetylase [Clostridia bacterium]
MKMIIRADDVGFSEVCNIGTFETFDHGLSTSADVMLDCPGTEDALRRLRDYPWISVGWHTHMWGSPVLGAAAVPSLVEHGGEFDGRFRSDLNQIAEISYEEALRELSAQLERCRDILGRYPDTGSTPFGSGVWAKALLAVQVEHGIPTGFARRLPSDGRPGERIRAGRERGEEWAFLYNEKGMPGREPDAKWADRKIVVLDGSLPYMDLLTDSISDIENNYDPVLYYTEDRAGILNMPDDVTVEQSWHPGYLDYFVYRLGERMNRPRARQFTVARCQDVSALCDRRLFDWIREHRIELVNFRDALYGTQEYQRHLLETGSDLCML